MKHPCILIPKNEGEPVRKVILELDLLDKGLKIVSVDVDLCLPLSRMLSSEEMALLPKEARQDEREFESHDKFLTLEDILGFTPSYEVVGDIALIEADEADAFDWELFNTSKEYRKQFRYEDRRNG